MEPAALPERAQATETRTFRGQSFDVALIQAVPPDGVRFPPLEPGTTVENGIRVDRDVAVKMRDGVTIYTDIYRPDGATDVPAIVAWSPYGKRTSYVHIAVAGVPAGTLSPGTKLEGIDPDFWCRRGYAVINPDARGAGHSEGVLQLLGPTEGEDIHDLVEWLAVQDWCNGRVGMAGNSWLAMSQWAGAATKPPHLACFAPWEGTTDFYRNVACPGGIPDGFTNLFNMILSGDGMMEDVPSNVANHPHFDTYWQAKIPDLAAIEAPVYITGGWSHHFHLRGAIDAWRKISSKDKWLRIHREFEWPDFYTPENLEDLDRFFTRYLKNQHNGWELTPPVRIDVMDRGDRDHVTRRAEIDFPLPDTMYHKLYLGAGDASLNKTPQETATSVSYEATTGITNFDFTMEHDVELTGFFKLRLWVEAKGSDEADIFVAIQKADANGNMVPTFVIGSPHPGAPGALRVSLRELDEAASTESEPVQSYQRSVPLQPGEIVPVEIPIWPTSRYFRKGERLRVQVSGHYVRDKSWFEPLTPLARNSGEHVIHTGGDYDSHLLVPVIPELREVIPGRSITSARLMTMAELLGLDH